jgi:hypothetical protein
VGLKTILKYDIQNLVPFETGTTFRELAEKTGVPEKKLTRMLRHGITDHFFRETQPGHIRHTAATKALAVMPVLGTWASMGMYDVGPAKMRVRSHSCVTKMTAYCCSWWMRLLNGPTQRSPTTR